MKLNHKFALLLAGAVLAGALVGCGASGTPAGSAASSEAAASSAVSEAASEPAAEAALPDGVFGKLFQTLPKMQFNVWVSTPSFAQMCFLDKTFGKITAATLRAFLPPDFCEWG